MFVTQALDGLCMYDCQFPKSNQLEHIAESSDFSIYTFFEFTFEKCAKIANFGYSKLAKFVVPKGVNFLYEFFELGQFFI